MTKLVIATMVPDQDTKLLPIERVRELSQLRPRRAVVDAIACWLLIGLAATTDGEW